MHGVRQIEPDEDYVEDLDEYENPFKAAVEHGSGSGVGSLQQADHDVMDTDSDEENWEDELMNWGPAKTTLIHGQPEEVKNEPSESTDGD